LIWEEANPLEKGPYFCKGGKQRCWNTQRANINDMILVLWKYYEALLHPHSPIYVAKSTVAGLGIFLKKSIRLEEGDCLLNEHLYGALFDPGEVQEELKELKYPSLYDSALIMCGPLALSNHNCASSLRFSCAKLAEMEEFQGIQFVRAVSVKNFFFGRKDQEILINYYKKGENCEFASCRVCNK
jgi:hypothetical protein